MSLPHTDINDAEGFVLAGGRSRRMGGDKALIHQTGVPLIQRALAVLSTAGLQARIAGARTDLSSFGDVVPDEPVHADLGPLSGICSALSVANSRYAVVLPVDLPLIPASLIIYLLGHAITTESIVAVVSVAGFVQTFPAVIDRVAAPNLHASLESQHRNTLTAFRNAGDALGRPLSVLPLELLVQVGHVFHPDAIPAAFWFLNVNTPDDLSLANALSDRANRVS